MTNIEMPAAALFDRLDALAKGAKKGSPACESILTITFFDDADCHNKDLLEAARQAVEGLMHMVVAKATAAWGKPNHEYLDDRDEDEDLPEWILEATLVMPSVFVGWNRGRGKVAWVMSSQEDRVEWKYPAHPEWPCTCWPRKKAAPCVRNVPNQLFFLLSMIILADDITPQACEPESGNLPGRGQKLTPPRWKLSSACLRRAMAPLSRLARQRLANSIHRHKISLREPTHEQANLFEWRRCGRRRDRHIHL